MQGNTTATPVDLSQAVREINLLTQQFRRGMIALVRSAERNIDHIADGEADDAVQLLKLAHSEVEIFCNDVDVIAERALMGSFATVPSDTTTIIND